MSLSNAIEIAARNYSKWAEDAERKALTDKQRASWLNGQAAGFRQAAIDLRTLADLADADRREKETER
jgi:hypothetical protein